jgi:hypothetical protein
MFISALAFDEAELQDQAKLAILIAVRRRRFCSGSRCSGYARQTLDRRAGAS